MIENYDERNVADRFRGMETEDIATYLRETASPFQAWFINLTGDFNKATGVRNANAFNAEQVVFFGDKKWDRRGAVGTYHYTKVLRLPYDDIVRAVGEAKINGYTVIGVDNVEGAAALSDVTYPYDPYVIFIFGEEQAGLSDEILALCDGVVMIPQLGSVRSLNVGTASGIIFYDFCRKIGLV